MGTLQFVQREKSTPWFFKGNLLISCAVITWGRTLHSPAPPQKKTKKWLYSQQNFFVLVLWGFVPLKCHSVKLCLMLEHKTPNYDFILLAVLVLIVDYVIISRSIIQAIILHSVIFSYGSIHICENSNILGRVTSQSETKLCPIEWLPQLSRIASKNSHNYQG